MHLKFLQAGTMQLAYRETNSDRTEIIFFLHGNSSSSANWQQQLCSNILASFRLVAFDLPGHGASATATQPADDYAPAGTAALVAEAINKIAAGKKFIVIGFSYGANIVAEMLAQGLQPNGVVLISGTVLGNNHGYDKVFKPATRPSVLTYNEKDESIIAAFYRKCLPTADVAVINELTKYYLAVHPDFKPALYAAAAAGKIADEVAALHQFGRPVLVMFGADDALVQTHYLNDKPFACWNNKVYQFAGAGHWVHVEEAIAVNKLIAEYAATVFI